jgi:site-specific DNA recombinase
VEHADTYADPDMSASRFATKKNRPEFERMVADVKAGKLDVLWFWEISRQQRRLDVFAGLRDMCRGHGVLWVMRDRVADPADSKDPLLAGIQSMMAEDGVGCRAVAPLT